MSKKPSYTELEKVWVPYFRAANALGITAIPDADLGPAVQLVRENFAASLRAFIASLPVDETET